MDKAKIDFAEINKYGAVVVYGSEGIKQYYGYTISEAKRLYREDARIFKNHRRKKMPEMTIEAAIIELNRLKSQERMDIDRERMITAVDTLTKAARYRLKQKIIMRNGWDICPHCCEILGNTDERFDLMLLNMPYCKRCGQALDWSDF